MNGTVHQEQSVKPFPTRPLESRKKQFEKQWVITILIPFLTKIICSSKCRGRVNHWSVFTAHRDISLDMLLELKEKPHWGGFEFWRYAASAAAVTMEDFQQYTDIGWDWYWLSRNPNLTIDILNTYRTRNWNWEAVSANPGITMIDIENHLHLPWDWFHVSENPNFCMDMTHDPSRLFSWGSISSNPGITLLDVLKFPDQPFFIEKLCQNRNITLEMIADEDGYFAPLDTKPLLFWIGVSSNPNLTLKFILEHPNWKWKWEVVSSNPGIQMADVISHSDLPWSTEGLSKNPNLTMEMLANSPELHWVWRLVVYLPFTLDKLEYLRHGHCSTALLSLLDQSCCNYSVDTSAGVVVSERQGCTPPPGTPPDAVGTLAEQVFANELLVACMLRFI